MNPYSDIDYIEQERRHAMRVFVAILAASLGDTRRLIDLALEYWRP